MFVIYILPKFGKTSVWAEIDGDSNVLGHQFNEKGLRGSCMKGTLSFKTTESCDQWQNCVFSENLD